MTFKTMSARFFEPLSQWLMVIGIVALCQPWNLFIHRYGVTITLLGLAGFLVFSHVKPDIEED
jgi:hypothetical protein